MKTLYSIGILFSLTCNSFDSLGQGDFRPGYLIKNNQDSIPGFVSYGAEKSNTEKCLFKESKRGDYTAYNAEQITGYGFLNDKVYKSMQLPHETSPELPNKKVFLKLLVRGPLSLYRYQKYYFLDKDGLILIPPPVDKIVETSSGRVVKQDRRYVDIINSFIDHADITANRSAYSEDDLTALIEKYNHSLGYTAIAPKNSKPAVSLSGGLLGGYIRSKVTMDYFGSNAFKSSSTVAGGIFINLSSPRVYDRLFFSLEVWYQKIFYQGYHEYRFSADLIRQDILVDLSFLKSTVGLKYHILGLHNTPYIKGGLSVYALNKTSISVFQESEQAGGVIVSDDDQGENYRIRRPIGYWLAVGYDKQIADRLNLFGEFRVERNNGFVGTKIQSASTVTDLNLLVGLRF
jgi:hypothetical protein